MAAGNEKITFPTNYYYGTKMNWRPLIEELKKKEEEMAIYKDLKASMQSPDIQNSVDLDQLEEKELKLRNIEDIIFGDMKFEEDISGMDVSKINNN